MLSRCFLDFSVGVGTFVTGLNQISSFSHCATEGIRAVDRTAKMDDPVFDWVRWLFE